jgi:hypothetical protein
MLVGYNIAYGLEMNRFIQNFIKCSTVMCGAGEVCEQSVSCSILCVVSDEIYASGCEMMFKNLASHCVILSHY